MLMPWLSRCERMPAMFVTSNALLAAAAGAVSMPVTMSDCFMLLMLYPPCVAELTHVTLNMNRATAVLESLRYFTACEMVYVLFCVRAFGFWPTLNVRVEGVNSL